jgi:hypothetical protein
MDAYVQMLKKREEYRKATENLAIQHVRDLQEFLVDVTNHGANGEPYSEEQVKSHFNELLKWVWVNRHQWIREIADRSKVIHDE